MRTPKPTHRYCSTCQDYVMPVACGFDLSDDGTALCADKVCPGCNNDWYEARTG